MGDENRQTFLTISLRSYHDWVPCINLKFWLMKWIITKNRKQERK